jgi:hypothetical protein
MFSLQDILSHG